MSLTQYFVLFTLLLTFVSCSQPLVSFTIGGSGSEQATASVLSKDGDSIFSIGSLITSGLFSNIPMTKRSSNPGFFVGKTSVNGTVQWVNTFEGTGASSVSSVASDSNDNVYVAGSYKGVLSIGGVDSPSSTTFRLFLAKFDKSGQALWFKPMSAQTSVARIQVVSDQLYLACELTGSVAFTTSPAVTYGSVDVNIIKFNANGTALWQRAIGSSTIDRLTGFTVNNDDTRITASGTYGNTLNIQGHGSTVAYSPTRKTFIVTLNNAGSTVFAKGYEGTAIVTLKEIVYAPNNTIYSVGSFNGVFEGLSNERSQVETFLMSLSGNTGARLSIEKFSGTDTVYGSAIAVNGAHLYIAIDSFSDMIIDEAPYYSPSGYSLTVIHINLDKKIVQWVRQIEGIDANTNNVLATSSGHVFVYGSTSSQLGNLETSGMDGFLIQVAQPCPEGYGGSMCQYPICFEKEADHPRSCSGNGTCSAPNNCTCGPENGGLECEHPLCYSIVSTDPLVCSGNGICHDVDTCICAQNWTGINCDIPYCYGIEAVNSSVCSGNGQCNDVDYCHCNEGYGGDNCQYASCFSYASNDPDVCSGHGACTEPDVCECDQGFEGLNCSNPICFGVSATQSFAVCSGKGSCLSPDRCQCEEGYIGPDCSVVICFNIPSNDSNVCEGRGTCYAPDSCLCPSGYSGSECTNFVCFDIPSLDVNVCSGHGECTAPDTCSCDSSFSGSKCEAFACFGVDSQRADTCSGHGSCIRPNNCSCAIGYTNSNCSVPICYKVPGDQVGVCSGHGVCDVPDTCVCAAGFGGSDCSNNYCFGISSNSTAVCSGHGSCVLPNTCLCEDGFVGTDCSASLCFGVSSVDTEVCSGQGTCVSPNNCQCNTGYTGEDCILTICFGTNSNDTNACFGHGLCVNPDDCHCEDGYTNDDCSSPICFGVPANNETVCSGYGYCESPDTCICDHNITTADCSSVQCYGFFPNEHGVCSGHGVCEQDNLCNCGSGYSGNSCEIPICFGIEQGQNDVCSSHGVCLQPDNCMCDNGYIGEECSQVVCFGTNSSDTNICTNHGVCSSPDNCTCSTGYTNFDCSTPICFGVEGSGASVCSGHGVCESHNRCSCQSGYTGPDCSNIVCYGKNQSDTSICSGHGSCIEPDRCLCTTGYTSDSCNVPVCYGAPANNPVACSGHGTCTSPDHCTCLAGYTSFDCSDPMCYGIAANNSAVCSSYGSCVEPNKCECEFGITTPNCATSNCFGLVSTVPAVCSGHGFCIGTDECKCQSSYKGSDCSTAICFGIEAGNSSVCSGHGECGVDGQAICSCEPGYDGPSCENFVCFNISSISSAVCNGGACVGIDTCDCSKTIKKGASCDSISCFGELAGSTVCTGHGICVGHDVCECFNGYSGSNCSALIDDSLEYDFVPLAGLSTGQVNFLFTEDFSDLKDICFSWSNESISVLTGLKLTWYGSTRESTVGTSTNEQCFTFLAREQIRSWNVQATAVNFLETGVGNIKFETTIGRVYESKNIISPAYEYPICIHSATPNANRVQFLQITNNSISYGYSCVPSGYFKLEKNDDYIAIKSESTGLYLSVASSTTISLADFAADNEYFVAEWVEETMYLKTVSGYYLAFTESGLSSTPTSNFAVVALQQKYCAASIKSPVYLQYSSSGVASTTPQCNSANHLNVFSVSGKYVIQNSFQQFLSLDAVGRVTTSATLKNTSFFTVEFVNDNYVFKSVNDLYLVSHNSVLTGLASFSTSDATIDLFAMQSVPGTKVADVTRNEYVGIDFTGMYGLFKNGFMQNLGAIFVARRSISSLPIDFEYWEPSSQSLHAFEGKNRFGDHLNIRATDGATDSLEMVYQYKAAEGLRTGLFNFELKRDHKAVQEMCLQWTNNTLAGLRIKYFDDDQYDTVGLLSEENTKSCFVYRRFERIVSWQAKGGRLATQHALQGQLSGVSFVTDAERTFDSAVQSSANTFVPSFCLQSYTLFNQKPLFLSIDYNNDLGLSNICSDRELFQIIKIQDRVAIRSEFLNYYLGAPDDETFAFTSAISDNEMFEVVEVDGHVLYKTSHGTYLVFNEDEDGMTLSQVKSISDWTDTFYLSPSYSFELKVSPTMFVSERPTGFAFTSTSTDAEKVALVQVGSKFAIRTLSNKYILAGSTNTISLGTTNITNNNLFDVVLVSGKSALRSFKGWYLVYKNGQLEQAATVFEGTLVALQHSSDNMAGVYEYNELGGFMLGGVYGQIEDGVVKSLGPIGLKKYQEQNDYSTVVGVKVGTFLRPNNIKLVDPTISEICCWKGSKAIAGITLKTKSGVSQAYGKQKGFRQCLFVYDFAVKWETETSTTGGLAMLRLSTTLATMECAVDSQYRSGRIYSSLESYKLVGVYGSANPNYIDSIGPIWDNGKVLYNYLNREGAKSIMNYDLTSNFKQVREFCYNYDTQKYVVSGFSIKWYNTTREEIVGAVNQTRSCFTFDLGTKVRYFNVKASRLDLNAVVGEIRFSTTTGATFSTPSIPFDKVFTRVTNGESTNAEIDIFEHKGVTLVGFSASSENDKLVSLAPVFKKLESERQRYVFSPPVGDSTKLANFQMLDDTAVETICCWVAANSITRVYLKTKNGEFASGDVSGAAKCLNVNNRPITTFTMRRSTKSDSNGAGRLGHLRVEVDSDVLDCQITNLQSLSVVSTIQGPRKLMGLYGNAAGGEIVNFGPIWSNGIKNYALVAYYLDNDAAAIIQNTPKSVVTQELINYSQEEQTMSFTGEYASTIVETIETSEALSSEAGWSVSASVSVGIKLLAAFELGGKGVEASIGASITIGGSGGESKGFERAWTQGRTTETTKSFSYNYPIVVPPKSKITGSVLYYEIRKTTNWNGILEYEYEDGTKEYAPVSGTFQSLLNQYLLSSFGKTIAIQHGE